ncbi:MAG: hypothetical protein FWC28_06420 [Proteobacteria bacterium]|nr:hypothetical protein [Cystobacterineae bacterium]MCL2259010.1 hypothetical protein [Cystobacterineae bacterium]MCL2314865.1 hypothetical protein [Pseudomonadota bacterium]
MRKNSHFFSTCHSNGWTAEHSIDKITHAAVGMSNVNVDTAQTNADFAQVSADSTKVNVDLCKVNEASCIRQYFFSPSGRVF